MRKWLLLLPILLLVAAAGPALAETERILHFHSDVTVEDDGLLSVTETIEVRAEGQQIKRGIYRDFPTLYRAPWLMQRAVSFKVIKVLRDGRSEPYHVERLRNGKRIYVGHKDRFLKPGNYTYTIVYKTGRQLGFFGEHDELEWNATGNDWAFPIERATVRVKLPSAVPRGDVKTDGNMGPQGAKGKDFTAGIDAEGDVVFSTTRVLRPREGLTIVVGWPKGYVLEPTAGQKAMFWIQDNTSMGIGLMGLLLLVVYYLGAWDRVGRDPAKGTIIPLFEPPEGFSPAAVRCLMEMGYDNKCFTAAVVNMAVKRYLTIRETDGQGDSLKKVAEDSADLAPEEVKVASTLLGTSGRITLKQKSHRRIGKAIEALKAALTLRLEKHYFVTNRRFLIPGMVISVVVILAAGLLSPSGNAPAFGFMVFWLSIWSLVVGALLAAAFAQWRSVFKSGPGSRFTRFGQAVFLSLFALPFIGGEIMGLFFLTMSTSIWMIPIVAVVVFVNLLFYYLLKAPTAGGRKIMDQIEGFRMYLGAAEKDRLQILHAPERTPEQFEKMLPYALALDVENTWAEQFADVIEHAAQAKAEYSPSWYHGTSWSTLGAGGFTSSIGSSFSRAIASSASAPGTTSGFSGGGGGGGSSGGGGGGGGGGGW